MAGEIDTAELGVGDTIEMPGGALLTIVGVAPASAAPESAGDAPLYEAELTHAPDTLLYRPHNLDHALAGGAEYVGRFPRTDETDPFFCAGCKVPARGGERYEASAPPLDADVCCYGCEQRVEKQQRKARREERTANH